MKYGARILLVDHSPVLRTLASLALGGVGGFSVTATADACDALELASAERFDAVVVDQGLPGLSGLDLVRELRRREHYRDRPMLLLIDPSETWIEREALASGVDAIVTKPFDPDTLRATLSRAIDSRGNAEESERRMLGVQSVLDSIPYPAMVLTASHEVVMGNRAFWRTTEQGIGDCAIDCRVAMHESGHAPSACPLVQCVSTGEPVEHVIDEPALGQTLVCVYPMSDSASFGQQLFLHLTRPAGKGL